MSILGGSSIGILDISDGIISGTKPRNPVEGMLWIDTSKGSKTLKVYHNGRWETQTLDVGQLDPDLMTKINGIMDNLGTIGDDGILTFSDRVTLVKELGQIIGTIPSKASGNVYPSSLPAYNVLDSSGSGSFANIRARALSVGIETNSSWYKDLESAYTSLNSYLSQYSPKPWDVTTANKDKNTKLTDPDMFRQKFLNYYLAELSLTTETEIAAKKAAEDYTDRLTDGSSVIDKATSSGNTTFTDKADDDSVVHVEIEGKSVGGGSGKNLFTNFNTAGEFLNSDVLVGDSSEYTDTIGVDFSNNEITIPAWDGKSDKYFSADVHLDNLEPSTSYVFSFYTNKKMGTRIYSFLGDSLYPSGSRHIRTFTTDKNGRCEDGFVFVEGKGEVNDKAKIRINQRLAATTSDLNNTEPLVIYKLQLEKGSKATEYERPTPTPNNPIKIESLTAKNLFNGRFNEGFIGTGNDTPRTDPTWKDALYSDKIPVEEGKTYLLTGISDTDRRIRAFDSKGVFVNHAEGTEYTVAQNVSHVILLWHKGLSESERKRNITFAEKRTSNSNYNSFDLVSSVCKMNLFPSPSSEYREINVGQWNGEVLSRRHISELGLKHGDIVTFGVDIKPIGKSGLCARVDFYTSPTGIDGKEIHYHLDFVSKGNEESSYVTFTVDSSKPYITFYVQNENNTTETTNTSEQVKHERLVIGTKEDADKWTPAPEDIQPDTPNPIIYKTNISLPEPLRSVGDVKDKLFRDVDGLWKIERNVKEQLLDSTVMLQYSSVQVEGFTKFYTTQLTSYKYDTPLMSNRFKTLEMNEGFKGTEIGISSYSSNRIALYGVLPTSLVDNNTTAIRRWFLDNPTTILYVPEIPTIEILPDDLQQKLNNIQSYKGSNYVYTANTNLDKIGISPTLNATFKSKGWYDKWKTNDNVKDIVDNKIPEVQEEIKEATRLPVRYIRDTLAGNSVDSKSQWVEIQAVRGKENVAFKKPVELSTSGINVNTVTDGSTISSSFAEINNTTTSESDNEGNTVTTVTPEYVVVDLGKVYKNLDYIKVWHYYQDNRTYNGSMLEVSPDGEEWTTVFDSSLSGTYEETSSGRAYSLVANDLANNLLSQTTNLTSRVTDVERLTNAESIVDTVMSQSKFTSWQESVDAKPDQKDLQNVTDTLDATSEKVETISTDLSKVEQTAKDWGVALTQQQEILNEQGETVNQVVTYMKFKATGLEIGKSDSEMKVNISNTQIDFMDNGVSVAWINGQQLYIRNAQILNSLVIGNHKFEKLPNGMTAVNWFGD